MPTLRAALALLRPHGAALVILALFLAAGLAVLDDYGLPEDSVTQRTMAAHNVAYVLSIESDALASGALYYYDLFYGMAFEAPLFLTERALGLQEGREIFLARHLVIRFFFLTGGLFAYLLARRLLGGGVAPVAATLLLFLTPYLHAHSFFNSKDIPFLVMFVIALFLAHRAFRRDTLWSFALLGAGVGMLVNLRIMGVVLLAAVPAARALDTLHASNPAERKRAFVTTGVFALASALTFYATMPPLWVSPLGQSIEWWTTLSNHPLVLWQLLGGEPVVTSNLPSRYLPEWFSITNSPAFLLLGGVGALAACGAGAMRFRRALRNTRLRFLILIFACFALPVLAVILLQPNVYNGWRQLYFLCAPFSLLAAFGLRAMASAFPQKRLRTAVYGAAAAAACAGAVSIVLLHPHQHVYFNFFVDRIRPERLRAQYDLNHWAVPSAHALRLLLQERPAETIPVHGRLQRSVQLLPEFERRRIVGTDAFEAYYLGDSLGEWMLGAAASPSHVPPGRRVEIYGSTLYWVSRFAVDGPDAAPYRAAYDALSSADPALRSVFNVYLDGDSLVYAKEQCVPQDIARKVFLHVYPKNLANAPQSIQTYGFQNLDFDFRQRGAGFDGKCLAVVPLPDYPIDRIATGQTGANPWREEFAPSGDAQAGE